ncbi:MAG: hypothetical protein ACXVCP_12935 [Bdellovibrio sp.]
MNLYFLSVYQTVTDVDLADIISAFIVGFRFDLLVLGFLFIPIYFVVLAQAFLERWPQIMFTAYKFYFAGAWLLICFSTFIDFFYFARYGHRMRFAEYMSWTPEVFNDQFRALPANQAWIFSAITFMLFSLGYMLIKAIKCGYWKDEFSPRYGSKFEVMWRILLPLFLIALAARGTIEPHHLALEHSEVSRNKVINEMALNAVWCFDK